LLCMSTEADWLPSASTRGLRSLWLHWEKSGTDEPISGYKATV
jgi:hypothetical protein